MTGNITISLRSAFDNFADPNLFIEAKNNNFPVQIKTLKATLHISVNHKKTFILNIKV